MTDYPTIFISYASKNISFAEKLAKDIEKRGLKCWYAKRDIALGSSYPIEIDKAISSCASAVVILSQEAYESIHVLREVEAVLGQKKKLVPIKVDDAEAPDGFRYFERTLQYLDWRQWEGAIADAAIAEIGDAPAPPTPSLLSKYYGKCIRNMRYVGPAAVIALAVAGLASWVAIDRLGGKMDKVAVNTGLGKKEKSDDPMKEIANMGRKWTSEDVDDAVRTANTRAVTLYIDGGWRFGAKQLSLLSEYFGDLDQARVDSVSSQLHPKFCEQVMTDIDRALAKDEMAYVIIKRTCSGRMETYKSELRDLAVSSLVLGQEIKVTTGYKEFFCGRDHWISYETPRIECNAATAHLQALGDGRAHDYAIASANMNSLFGITVQLANAFQVVSSAMESMEYYKRAKSLRIFSSVNSDSPGNKVNMSYFTVDLPH